MITVYNCLNFVAIPEVKSGKTLGRTELAGLIVRQVALRCSELGTQSFGPSEVMAD